MSRKRPTISLVGRPNVGKSSLFNRLLRKANQAIAFDCPGVTRDRHYSPMTFEGSYDAIMVDTGGFYPDVVEKRAVPDNPKNKEFLRQQHRQASQEDFLGLMTEQAILAMKESDLVLLVVDVREGPSPLDEQLAQKIRQTGKPFWVLANKFDTYKQSGQEALFYCLGISDEELFPVSAAHGEGFPRLEEALISFLKNYYDALPKIEGEEGEEEEEDSEGIVAKLAIIGAPNAGKSTLLNRLVKEERSLVSALPGTTMDPVRAYFDLYLGAEGETEDGDRWGKVEIIDTAGIRRKSMIKEELESISVFRALKVIDEADIVLLMVDALKGISHHDRRLCEIVLEKGKSLIILLNKVDLIERADLLKKDEFSVWLDEVKKQLPWSYSQILPLSAKTGSFLGTVRKALKETILTRQQKLGTGELNTLLENLMSKNPLSLRTKRGGKILKLRYATLVKNDPPTVLIFSNLTQEIPMSYRRYLVNGIREHFHFKNTPIHLVFRKEA